MNARHWLPAMACILLYAVSVALPGCATAVREVPAAQKKSDPAPVADPELSFTEANVRKYCATFPPFIRRLQEISELKARDPDSGESREKIRELSRRNDELVAVKGWSGMDVFVEFNRKVVHYLTAHRVMQRYRASGWRYPGAEARYRDQVRALEKELGRDGYATLIKNADRIKIMYRQAGIKVLD